MWVQRGVQELEIRDRVKAVHHEEKDRDVIGIVAKKTGLTGVTILRDENGYTATEEAFRTYYRWEPNTDTGMRVAKTDYVEVEVNGHTFTVSGAEHLRVWIEDTKVHVELVLDE